MDLDTFRLVTDLLPEAMLLVAPGGLIRAANRKAIDCCAPPGGALEGRNLAEFSSDPPDWLRGVLSDCAAGGGGPGFRLSLRGPAGRVLSYAASAAAIPGADGGAGPLIQLRLSGPEAADDGGGLRHGAGGFRQRLDDLRRRSDDRSRLRERIDDLQRQLEEQVRLRHQFAERALRLEQAALHDHLTGLANRVLFGDRLARAVAAARREGDRLCVMMIDLDGFKAVNDTLGHDAGDRVLCAVARRLRSIMRGADTVARLGGDEFAVLMETAVTPAGAEAAAAKIEQALDLPFAVDGRAFDLGASIGYALFPDDGVDGEVLLRRADAAMYRTKHAAGTGRDDGRRARTGAVVRVYERRAA